MILIKGNKALAKELGVSEQTIFNWKAKEWIKPLKRIGIWKMSYQTKRRNKIYGKIKYYTIRNR